MKPSNTALRTLIHTLLFSSVVMPLAAQAAVDDVVFLWGTSTDTETMFAQDQFGQVGTVDTAAACGRVVDFIALNANMVDAEMGSGAAEEILRQNIPEENMQELLDCANEDPDAPAESNIWLIYTSCSMTMGNGTHVMRWTVPPLAAEAEMAILDMATNEGFMVPLETSLKQVRETAPLNAMGNLRGYELTGPHQTRQVSLRVDSVQREFQAKSYNYNYTGDVGAATSGMAAIQVGKIVSTGKAWIIPNAPGSDVVKLFYKNFRDYVEPPTGMGSMLGGMIKQMAGLTDNGLPVITEHTVTMEVASIMGMMGAPGAGQKSESTTTIDRMMVLPGKAAQTCGATVFPEGMQVQNLNDMMADAMGGGSTTGAGAGSGGADLMGSPEMQDAMRQMSEQFENMSPEERQMMESMGLGGLMQSSGGAPVTKSAAGNTTGGSSKSKSSMPSADDLYSDNMTVMSQKHLQALGYDIDNTSGNASMKTMIAISQFQSENGLKVTGEVSPQLVGALSAAVDKRR